MHHKEGYFRLAITDGVLPNGSGLDQPRHSWFRYTLAKFSHELSLPSFYKQPAEVQQQVRIEKIGLLELQDADPQLAERLRSHEIILELWQSEGSFERDCLMRILREIPLVYGPWKALSAPTDARQKVTGLVVNDGLSPRVERKIKRQLRAAIHNLKQGKELRQGETIDSLRGMAAFVSMTQRAIGRQLMDQINEAAASMGG